MMPIVLMAKGFARTRPSMCTHLQHWIIALAARLAVALATTLSAAYATPAHADPVRAVPYRTFAGNLDFVVTGGSLRNTPNTNNACALSNADSSPLAGIPSGATIHAAYLYWAGSGPTPDTTVSLSGTTVVADRTFTESYAQGGLNLRFFSGFADVTNVVATRRNGNYSFSGLSVTNTNLGGGQNYCAEQAVLSGWGLVVIFEDPAQPLRIVQLFDGFEHLQGNQATLPHNFAVPATGVDGKLGVLSWEGDIDDSARSRGSSEGLIFDGQSAPPTSLSDPLNPPDNPHNSTINTLPSDREYGVDFDIYDISPGLRSGDTSAVTTVATGSDLILLSAAILSVASTDMVDLALAKTLAGNLSAGQTDSYDLTVTNNGPGSGPKPNHRHRPATSTAELCGLHQC